MEQTITLQSDCLLHSGKEGGKGGKTIKGGVKGFGSAFILIKGRGVPNFY
jgi:hypothetical protein